MKFPPDLLQFHLLVSTEPSFNKTHGDILWIMPPSPSYTGKREVEGESGVIGCQMYFDSWNEEWLIDWLFVFLLLMFALNPAVVCVTAEDELFLLVYHRVKSSWISDSARLGRYFKRNLVVVFHSPGQVCPACSHSYAFFLASLRRLSIMLILCQWAKQLRLSHLHPLER